MLRPTGHRRQKMDESLIALETKIAYLEHSHEELNLVVFRQQEHIDRLEMAIRKLAEKMNRDEALITEQGEETPPPHY